MDEIDSTFSQFTRQLETSYSLEFANFSELHHWACRNPDCFWSSLLAFSNLDYSGDASLVLSGSGFIERKFFPQLSLNYSRNLLRGYDSEQVAVTVVTESGGVNSVSRGELISLSMRAASALLALGIQQGDRIVAIARNSVESIAACLASASIGAIWSSVSPELGVHAIQERFGQLEPRLLFGDSSYTMQGVTRSANAALVDLADNIDTLEHIVVLSGPDLATLDTNLDQSSKPSQYQVQRWEDLVACEPLVLDELEDFPFDHPLFVMFSSGTTGKPKCIVHGAGGTLLEHVKEHRLHSNLSDRDTLLFQTSSGWMMWNWQLSALASGTHIMLYDGSVSYPDKTHLLDVLEEHGVSVFGTSPAYIQYLIESGVKPEDLHEFRRLRCIQSTGSILYESQFEWITQSFKNIPVQSISGGTDMIGCLVLGHPDMPVRVGDSQCISLGLDVRVKTDDAISRAGKGELVVVKPFPSQPVFFWNDPAKEKLKASYFKNNPGVWTHGDEIRITPEGSPRILGRSDGTLNVRGVRIGPSEILSIVNQIKGIRESMVIEQDSPREPGGTRLVLLLVLQENVSLERNFILQIKKHVATSASRLHVPAVVVHVSSLPRTHNGKLSEKAARDAVNGRVAGNLSALANPEVLSEIQQVVPAPPV